MKRIIDERVKLPRVWKHVLVSVGCISGLAFIFKDGAEKDISFSFLLLFSGVFTGLAVWSLASLINYLVNWVKAEDKVEYEEIE